MEKRKERSSGCMLMISITDNAIPIEGWISDPTDNDLLNLIPILEGLQYSTDVRALLSLRLGQPQLES
jgi:CTD nuclear envelope phosphatase 1